MDFMKPILTHTTLKHLSNILCAIRVWIWPFTSTVYTCEILIVHIFTVFRILAAEKFTYSYTELGITTIAPEVPPCPDFNNLKRNRKTNLPENYNTTQMTHIDKEVSI
jgi:hypothetical protein